MVDLKRYEVLLEFSHFFAQFHHALFLCLPCTFDLFKQYEKAVERNFLLQSLRYLFCPVIPVEILSLLVT